MYPISIVLSLLLLGGYSAWWAQCSWQHVTLQGWVVMYAISQLVFGIGIGGEYPGAGTRATEESEERQAAACSARHRGRKVMLVAAMQVVLTTEDVTPFAHLHILHIWEILHVEST